MTGLPAPAAGFTWLKEYLPWDSTNPHRQVGVRIFQTGTHKYNYIGISLSVIQEFREAQSVSDTASPETATNHRRVVSTYVFSDMRLRISNSWRRRNDSSRCYLPVDGPNRVRLAANSRRKFATFTMSHSWPSFPPV